MEHQKKKNSRLLNKTEIRNQIARQLLEGFFSENDSIN